MPGIPALWEAKAGRSPEVGSLRPAWPTWQNPISTKNTKISRRWWQTPVIPATREDEATALQPGRQSETRSQKKKKVFFVSSQCARAGHSYGDTEQHIRSLD